MNKYPPYEPFPEPISPAEMDALSLDETSRLVAQRQESAARATLVSALLAMGRFEEALDLEADPKAIALIQRLIAAEAEPDDVRCDCVAMVDRADYTRDPQAKPKLKQVAKYQRRFRYWSLKYKTWVNCCVCSVCNHAQTLVGPIDEMHEAQEQLRAEAREAELAKTAVRVYPAHGS